MSNHIDEKIVLGLDTQKTAAQINADIKKLQDRLAQIQLNGALDGSATARKLNSQISALQAQLKEISVKAALNTVSLNSASKNAGTRVSQNIASGIRQSHGLVDAEIQNIADHVSQTLKNTTRAKGTRSASKKSTRKNRNVPSPQKPKEETKLPEETKDSSQGLQKLTASFKEQMTQAAQSIKQWLSLNTAVTLFISKTKEAIKELRQVNTLLTEISDLNDTLSQSDLERIGNNSFDIASKYGKSAADYLTGVQEALRAGYDNAEAIAELSLAAQTAGNMTAESANRIITAADEAYGMNGSVSQLTNVLDGMNDITDHHAVTMTQLADAMSVVASTAASLGVGIDQMTAVFGTIMTTTKLSASEAADAFRSILLYIGQVTDESAEIDAAGLSQYEAACNALNVKLRETKNGILSLRDPMQVLEELSAAYNSLDDTDTRKTGLLNSLDSELRATQLDSLLRQWDTYESMLQQYADGAGSMAKDAARTANSWEGSLKRLSNTWTNTLQTLTDSDAVITAINSLNGLLSAVNRVTEGLGPLASIGLGAGLFAGIKSYIKNFA